MDVRESRTPSNPAVVLRRVPPPQRGQRRLRQPQATALLGRAVRRSRCATAACSRSRRDHSCSFAPRTAASLSTQMLPAYREWMPNRAEGAFCRSLAGPRRCAAARSAARARDRCTQTAASSCRSRPVDRSRLPHSPPTAGRPPGSVAGGGWRTCQQPAGHHRQDIRTADLTLLPNRAAPEPSGAQGWADVTGSHGIYVDNS